MTDTTKLRELREKAISAQAAYRAYIDSTSGTLCYDAALQRLSAAHAEAHMALMQALALALPSLLDAADERDAMRAELEAKEAARAQAQEWLDRFQSLAADETLAAMKARASLAEMTRQHDEERRKVTSLREAWAPLCDKRCAETAMWNEDAFEHITSCAAFAPSELERAERAVIDAAMGWAGYTQRVVDGRGLKAACAALCAARGKETA